MIVLTASNYYFYSRRKGWLYLNMKLLLSAGTEDFRFFQVHCFLFIIKLVNILNHMQQNQSDCYLVCLSQSSSQVILCLPGENPPQNKKEYRANSLPKWVAVEFAWLRDGEFSPFPLPKMISLPANRASLLSSFLLTRIIWVPTVLLHHSMVYTTCLQ